MVSRSDCLAPSNSINNHNTLMKLSTFYQGVAAALVLPLLSISDLKAEAPLSLTKIGALPGLGGAEITAYDPGTQRLFITSGSGLNIVDFSDPANPVFLFTITPSSDGADADAITSVAVFNGIVAAAVPDDVEQDPGSVFFYSAVTGGFLKSVTVGALPDMLTFTPDGRAVLVANEGEPDYGPPVVDPKGSVSLIDISAGVGVATVYEIGFTDFDGQEATLRDAGVRIFPGRNASDDFEPEYIAVTPDGSTAFVTLQENNAVAKIDLASLTVTDILPLGLKDHSLPGNEIDANDDGTLLLGSQPVFGMYMPDAIATVTIDGIDYFLTANEGDDRGEDERVNDGSITLDPAVFPNAADLKMDGNIGRLGISTVDGQLDADADTEYEKLFSYGARSFSIRDTNGNLVFDSGSTLATVTAAEGVNPDDSRADNKGTEPEGVTTGTIGGRTFAFIGLERADAIAVFDISNPAAATFQDLAFDTGVDDAPEGLVFIPASTSPNGKSLLVVSNEGDDLPPALAVYRIDIATQPDITFLKGGVETGNDIYGPSGAGQLFSDRVKGKKSTLALKLENDGNATGTFQLGAFKASKRKYDIIVRTTSGENISAALRSGSRVETVSAFGSVGYLAVVRRMDRDKSSKLSRKFSAADTGSGLVDAMLYRAKFK